MAKTETSQMRFLVTTPPGTGHLRPALQLGEALQQAGHEVKIATAQGYQEKIERAGLQFVRAGLEWDMTNLAETVPGYREIPKAERDLWIFENIFLQRLPSQMVADLSVLFDRWIPDVIINNYTDLGGIIAAELANVPYATYHFPCYWSRAILAPFYGNALGKLRQAHQLPADPDCTALGRYLDLCFGLRDWNFPEMGNPDEWPPTAHFINPQIQQNSAQPPAWLDKLPAQPTVLLQLGTTYNTLHPELFSTAIAALEDTHANLIVLTGSKSLNKEHFGPQPSNIRVEHFVPFPEYLALLPHVDLLINHGGAFSVLDALIAGLPLAMLPLAAEQPWTTQACLALGVAAPFPPQIFRNTLDGPVVVPSQVTPAVIRDVAEHALATPGYRTAAQKAQQALQSLPGLPYAVEKLERLADTKQPIIDETTAVLKA